MNEFISLCCSPWLAPDQLLCPLRATALSVVQRGVTIKYLNSDSAARNLHRRRDSRAAHSDTEDTEDIEATAEAAEAQDGETGAGRPPQPRHGHAGGVSPRRGRGARQLSRRALQRSDYGLSPFKYSVQEKTEESQSNKENNQLTEAIHKDIY